MTSEDMELILVEDSVWLDVGMSCLSEVVDKWAPSAIGGVGEMCGAGSRTLMVTLLGVLSADGDIEVIPVWLGDALRGGVNEARALLGSDGMGWMRSADMLLRVRSPLSKRGRFLVTEESASSIGFRRGGLGPVELARVGG